MTTRVLPGWLSTRVSGERNEYDHRVKTHNLSLKYKVPLPPKPPPPSSRLRTPPPPPLPPPFKKKNPKLLDLWDNFHL